MKNFIKRSTFSLLFILTIIIVKLFAIDFYNIPSESMKGTLIIDDNVIVNKLYYGPRLPYSYFEIPWINLMRYINKDMKTLIDTTRWRYRRLIGFSKIKRNNIVVFNSPKYNDFLLIKRCVGLPGEIIKYKYGEIFINNKLEPCNFSDKIINTYQLWINDKLKFYQNMDPTQNLVSENEFLNYTYNVNMTGKELQSLKKIGCLDSFRILPIKMKYTSIFITEDSDIKVVSSSIDSIWIPKKGEKIQMNRTNYFLYNDIIRRFECRKICFNGTFFTENGIPIDSLTFSNNYYFMLGDNRNNSADSRFIGLIPEQNIIGKATHILFSIHDNKIYWDRFFKKIE